MEKKLLCVLFFLTCFTFYKAQSPTFQWVKSAGGTSAVEGHALTVDNTGNVITSGYFYGTADFDPGPSTYTLSSTGPRRDIFVLKLDALGNFIWAKQFSGLDFEDAISIITDPQGDLYISGYFESTVDFDPGLSTFNLTSNGNNDIFICKLNNSGNFLWAKSFGDVNNDYGNSVTIDTKGYPLILGSLTVRLILIQVLEQP
ncbi:MAG: hypothetical protein IPJ32_17375 [Sphingobacteriaceae bacterium]|nr:hypothetical protein [Sphingobacteriaceae bacterium]